MSNKSKQTGRVGEALFRAVCSDADVTVNPSIEDDYGWDALLEFPYQGDRDLPLDLQNPPPPVSVQVKSTKNLRANSASLKLTSATRLAVNPTPCFVALLKITGPLSAEIYVKHIWGDLLADILQAARKNSSSDKPAHKKFMSVRFSKADRHDDAFVPWLRKQISDVGRNYLIAKQRLIDTLGYEGGHGLLSLSVTKEKIEELAKLAVGLTDAVELNAGQLISRRFGIESPARLVQFGRISRQGDHGQRGLLRLRFGSGKTCDLPATFFGVPPSLESASQTVFRAKSEIVDLILAKNLTATSSLRVSAQDCLTLEAMDALASMGNETSSTAQVCFLIQGRQFPMGELNFADNEDQTRTLSEWSQFAPCIHALSMISKAAAAAPTISLAELDLSFDEVWEIARFVLPQAVGLGPPFAAVTSGQLVAYADCMVGHWRFVTLLRRSILPVAPYPTAVLGAGPCEILRAEVFPADTRVRPNIKAAYEDYISKERDAGACVVDLGKIEP